MKKIYIKKITVPKKETPIINHFLVLNNHGNIGHKKLPIRAPIVNPYITMPVFDEK